MSIIDDTHALVAREPTGDGYVIAFQSPTYEGQDPYYRTSYVHPFKDELRGAAIGDATIYPTYQAASIAAAGWQHTNKPGTRIIQTMRAFSS